jgi:hypothetical protein
MSRDVAIVIGTVVGGYFGEPGLGYAIGSLVGNAYDPVQIGKQGPRLNDLKVQVSDYGKMVPKLYGASRFAGNVIWSTDIIETQHTETSGGKGGGPEVTSTTYTYSQSFAVALCEGEVSGVGKIWANGKLIYNMGVDASFETIMASRAIASGIRFYPGSETQTADSLVEVYIGAGNTPAYRGTAYVVFENMQLANYGNRTPNMEFELIESGTFTIPYFTSTDNITGGAAHCEITETDSGYWWTTNGTLFNPANGIGLSSYDFTIQRKISAASGESLHARLPFLYSGTSQSLGFGASQATVYFVKDNGLSHTTLEYITDSTPVPIFSEVLGTPGDFIYAQFIVDDQGVFSVVRGAPTYETGHAGVITSTGEIWFFTASGSSIGKIYIYRRYDRQILREISGLNVYSGVDVALAFEFDGSVYYVNPTNGALSTYAINMTTGAITNLGKPTGFSDWGAAAYYSGKLYFSYSGHLKVYDLLTQALETNITLPFSAILDAMIIDSRGVLVGRSGGNFYSALIFETVIAGNSVSLSSAVSNICTRADLTAAQIDVTQLTDTVTGYVVQRSTARAQIEQLMQAFYFDAVESDGKVKFVKRGGAATLTISEDDVAAHLAGGQFPDNLTIERKQELELPVEINVQYMDIDTAYQVSSQRSQRLITDSSNKLALNFAISMDGSKAKQVSDVLMYDSWTARTSFSMQNGWKYSYLEPTDVVGVVKGALTYNVRLVDEDAASGVYARNAVLDDASVYTQSATAAPPLSPTTTVDAIAIINLMLLDIPLLRDQDDAVGFYAAACKYSGSWTGEQTFKSNDGGTSWTQSGRAILNEATIGSASTALGNFLGGNIFDELNSVTVAMINGTLSGTTELAVLNGANVILIGNEVLQFKNAALVSTGVYTLAGLLRGRRGTEWAMSTHAVGDRVVLLSTTTTYLFESSSAEYNLARQYRGVALGGFLDDASSISFTNTGVAQECYSPVLLGGGRDAANNLRLTWTRRTRIGGAWNNYADVPLGEAAEAYVVEIYSSSAYTTLLRTISGITTQNTTYTAAQQTTDGLTPGNTVYWIVYQVSATVGNGYGTRGAT